MICEKCNSTIPDDSDFCLKCGHKLNEKIEEGKADNKAIVTNTLFITIAVLVIACLLLYNSKQPTVSTKKPDNIINQKSNASKIEPESIIEEVSVKDILSEFQDWDGKKDVEDNIYTLNLNNDKYILTIKPQDLSYQTLKWADLYYFNNIDNENIAIEELKPMDDLASIVSRYWSENKLWIDKVVNKELPYEETYSNYILSVEEFFYSGEPAGLYFKISNTEQPSETSLKDSNKSAILKKAFLGANADKESAWIFAVDAVKSNLKAPSTAAFPWYSDTYVSIYDDGSYLVKAYVDAENSLGSKIRSNFSVRITIKSEYDYTYSDLTID